MSIKNAIETLYTDFCDIYGYVDNIEDGISHGQEQTLLYEHQPCRVSFSGLTAADQTDTVAVTDQTVKLFISPEISVREGSRIVVERDGEVLKYRHSGKSAVYPSHREIVLVPEEVYA